jgi:predicted DNA-binding transcriptional regulator YafY
MKEHDKLTVRLVQILIKFNEGAKLSVDELAEEFNVSARTIQRDFERLSYLPLVKEHGRYALAPYCLGKLSYQDMRQFAAFSGIRELYPELSDQFIVDLLNASSNRALKVNGHKYEDLSHKVEIFNEIAAAIVKPTKITFVYKAKAREVMPYKLINTNGIWYLVGVEGEVLKHFTFSRITNLQSTRQRFTPDREILQNLSEHRGVWVTQNPIEVVLEVDACVAEYFLRRDLLPCQEIVEQNEDFLLLSSKPAYEEEILKTVRYWIPHMKIRSPEYLQQRLEESLRSYLEQSSML